MSCTPTPCPPGAPAPNDRPDLTVPDPAVFTGTVPVASIFASPAPPGNHCLPQGVCNEVQQATATCGTGSITPPFTATVDACSFYAETVEEANAIALARAEFLAAAGLGQCQWTNTQQQYTAACPDGSVTLPVTVVVMPGEITSNVSQADADAQALALATAEAIAALPQCLYTNGEQCCTYTPYFGVPKTVTIPLGTIFDPSQALANQIALDAACTAAINKVFPTVITCTTYTGAYKWFGFKPYDWVNDGTVPERYLTKTGSGNNTILYAYGRPTGSNSIGQVDSTFSGSVNVSPITGVQTGLIQRHLNFHPGAVCGGASYAFIPPSGFTQDFGSDNVANLMTSYLYYQGPTVSHTSMQWHGVFDAGPGYGIALCGAGINGQPGTVTEGLSNRMTLEQAAAAGGATVTTSQCASVITSYNDGTSTANGIASIVHVTSPNPTTTGKFLITFTMSKTPIGGGATVFFTVYVMVISTVGGFINYDYQIPQVAGYNISLVNVLVTTSDEVSDDFVQTLPGTLYYGSAPNYPTTDFWTQPPKFDMQQPATECGSDWQDLVVAGSIVNDYSGYYWAGPAYFSMLDFNEVSDDFQAYVTGDRPILDKGYGWAAVGHFDIWDLSLIYDDFQSYPTGAITSLTSNTGNLLVLWVANGSFASFDYLVASDDLQSYSVGTITSLNGGTNWAASGTFQLFP